MPLRLTEFYSKTMKNLALFFYLVAWIADHGFGQFNYEKIPIYESFVYRNFINGTVQKVSGTLRKEVMAGNPVLRLETTNLSTREQALMISKENFSPVLLIVEDSTRQVVSKREYQQSHISCFCESLDVLEVRRFKEERTIYDPFQFIFLLRALVDSVRNQSVSLNIVSDFCSIMPMQLRGIGDLEIEVSGKKILAKGVELRPRQFLANILFRKLRAYFYFNLESPYQLLKFVSRDQLFIMEFVEFRNP